MIFDNLKNAHNYFNLSQEIKTGLEFLMNTNLKTLPCGIHEISGDKIFIIIQEYETKSNFIFEAHRKFIDIQFIISDKEKLGFCEISNCKESQGYNPERDIEFFNQTDCKKDANFIIAREGDFLIFFPHDAHCPSLQPSKLSNPNYVKKAVVKIAIS